MKESVYKSYDELPLMLNAETLAKVLGVAPSSAYELMHEKDFPTLKIGNRLVIPKEDFITVLEIIHHVEVLDGWTWWGRTAADKRETEAFAARWTSTMAEETRKVKKDVETDGKMQTTL